MHWKCQHRNIGAAVTSERAVSAAHPPRFIREIVNLVPRGCFADNSTCITGRCNFYSAYLSLWRCALSCSASRAFIVPSYFTSRDFNRETMNARDLTRSESLAGFRDARVKQIHHLCKFTRLLISVLYVRVNLSADYFPSYRIRFGRPCSRSRTKAVMCTEALAPERARDFRARAGQLRASIIIMAHSSPISYRISRPQSAIYTHYLAKYTSFVLSPAFSYVLSLAFYVCTARFYLNAPLPEHRLFRLAVTSLFSPIRMLKAFKSSQAYAFPLSLLPIAKRRLCLLQVT